MGVTKEVLKAGDGATFPKVGVPQLPSAPTSSDHRSRFAYRWEMS